LPATRFCARFFCDAPRAPMKDGNRLVSQRWETTVICWAGTFLAHGPKS
jgi:hypothetical protein